jgi:hypothetical protein
MSEETFIRTVNSVRNVRWADEAHTQIYMEVDFDELDDEFVPFAADPNDVEPHGRKLYADALAGVYGEVGEFLPPPDITGDEAMDMLRRMRDDKLTRDVDPVVSNPLRWEDLTAAQQDEWRTYRNALLDLTTTNPNPSLTWNDTMKDYVFVDLTFPTRPSHPPVPPSLVDVVDNI